MKLNVDRMDYVFAMPTGDTFSCPPIGEFVKYYLQKATVSVDVFARNKRWATYTNDLNPETEAEYHLDAVAFLELMVKMGVKADLVIFDPPYSPRQIKELYDSIGLKITKNDTQRSHAWYEEKKLVDQVLIPDGTFLYFGWDTTGMGKSRNYKKEWLMVVNHGPGHNDTLCLAERKIYKPEALL